MTKIFCLVHQQARDNCSSFAQTAPEGWVARFGEPARNLEQNARVHAMLGDLANQLTLHNRKWDAESMKRICVDQFRRDTAKDPDLAPFWDDMGTVEMCPSMDGTGIVALGWQTRRFPKKLATAFIEWLFALGAETGIRWTDPKEQA